MKPDSKTQWNVGYWLLALLALLSLQSLWQTQSRSRRQDGDRRHPRRTGPRRAPVAPQKLVFGHLSTGAADDLAKVTDIARDMVTRYGMVEQLGYVAYEAQPPRFLDATGTMPGGCPVSPATQERIDEALRSIVMSAFEQATAILVRHRETRERCARELLVRETLDEAAPRALTADLRPAVAATVPA